MRCGRCGVENLADMRFCGSCGAQLRDPSTRPPARAQADSAQRRHLTVMFCDLVDSTGIAEQLDPEDFRDVLTGYQAACARAIEGFQGHVAQWIGDGVLAYFGYPRAHEDDALRAVHAGLGIFDEMATLNEHLPALLRRPLQVRVGLHTGIVIAGEMGAGSTREQLAIVGETPHIAARLQALAPPGSVVVTDATRALVADRFATEPLEVPPLKGISRAIAVHRIVSLVGDGFSPAPAPDPRAPMIDRTAELGRLRDAWQGARRGGGTVIHVAGDAGIGKSRLVAAFREELRGEGASERVLRCSPHHSSTALYPAIRFLEEMTGLDRSRTPAEQLAAVQGAVRELDLPDAPVLALLADVLAIPGADESAIAAELMPRDARSATLQVLETLLVGDAARGPVLLVVEDLHWADPTTLELLERILAGLPGAAVACVLTFRRSFEPPWARLRSAIELDVGPLAREHVRALAEASSTVALDTQAISRVESVADGVPLFVEEMVRMLADQGESEAASGGAPGSAVPPTLQGLLAERLDRLPELAGVIDVAAVLGRDFERGLLQALSPPLDTNFGSVVAQLTAEDVLRPVEGSRSRLEFNHALLQEAAYERILRRRRPPLHRRVAELLATRTSSAWESEPERIAHHFTCAEEPEAAMGYWRQAGLRALKQAAFLEAAEHFRRAVEALDGVLPSPDGELERGVMLAHLAAAVQAGRTPAADVDDTYARARSAYQGAGRRDLLGPVIRGEWMFHLARAEYPIALELGDEMLALGEEGGAPGCLAEGHLYRGLARMYMGHLDVARAELDQAYRHHQRPERPDQIYEAQGDTGVGALAYLAIVLWNQGDTRLALETSELSLQLAEQTGGPVTLAQAWGMRGGLLLSQGKFAQFGPWLEKTLAHCADRNIGYWTTVCSMWSAWLLGQAGRRETAIPRLQGYLDAYVASGGRLGLPHFHMLIADLQLASNNARAALESLVAAEEHIEATGERYYEPELQWFLARAHMGLERPDPHAAATAYAKAIESASAQNAKLLELRAATGLALHESEVGRPPTALARVGELCRWFGEDSEVPDVIRARALLAGETSLA